MALNHYGNPHYLANHYASLHYGARGVVEIEVGGGGSGGPPGTIPWSKRVDKSSYRFNRDMKDISDITSILLQTGGIE